jgi:glycine/D-amino acid oxidase-like deaminating enzyme
MWDVEFIHSGLDTIAYRWSTHDYYTLDQVPYIGRLRRRSRHLYVATGFNGRA